MKKYLLKSAWLLCCIFISCESDISDFHQKSFIADAHNDVLLRSMKGKNILSNLSESHSDLQKFDEGGVDLQVFSIWVSPSKFEGEYFDRANNMITHLEYLSSKVPRKWSIPYNYQDILYKEQRDILSCMIRVGGGHALENDLLNLEKLYDRGMRYLGVNRNNSNDWATSANETLKTDSLEFIGLSEFGKEVIRKCNDLGIMIDISHESDQTIKDILKISNKPIIAPHYQTIVPDLDGLVDHIIFVKNLIGINHVGIGGDWDGVEVLPKNIEDIGKLPTLRRVLNNRGYTKKEIRKF